MTKYAVTVEFASFKEAQDCLSAFSDYKVTIRPMQDRAPEPIPHPDKRRVYRMPFRKNINGKGVNGTILETLKDNAEHKRGELADALVKAGYRHTSLSPALTELRRDGKVKETAYHVYALGSDD